MEDENDDHVDDEESKKKIELKGRRINDGEDRDFKKKG